MKSRIVKALEEITGLELRFNGMLIFGINFKLHNDFSFEVSST